MRIVPSQDLGSEQAAIGRPVVMNWRWHHHVPTLGLWAVVLMLLAAPKSNRHVEAWLILVPLGLVALVWQMPARLVGLPASETETFGFVVVTGALGWSAVWLLGDWLARRRGWTAFTAAMGVLLAVGGSSYLLHFAPEVGEDSSLMIAYGLSALILPTALMLARRCSGRRFRRGSVMGWQFLWTGLAAGAAMLLIMATMIAGAIAGEDGGVLWLLIPALTALIMLVFGSGFWTVLIYLFNLPFMLLAFNSPFYLRRFQAVLGYDEVDWPATSAVEERRSGPFFADPTSRPVTDGDVIGRWQFYLDDLARTILLDFRSDGTFSQTAVLNREGEERYPGGTWWMEGPKVYIECLIGTGGEDPPEARTWWVVDTPAGSALCGEVGPRRVVYVTRSHSPFASG